MTSRLFGTDGIRGRAGDGPLEEGRVSALGRSIGAVLKGRSREPFALLGNDGRRSGPAIEAALARGLAAAGFAVRSAGLITTPGLAWVGRDLGARVTVMVSASHNPASDNGIKVFGPRGAKLAPEQEDEIEAHLAAHPDPVVEGEVPEHDPSVEQRYLDHLLSLAGSLDLNGMHVAVDCANGGGSRIAPRVFARLGARVTTVAASPDGENINAECGSTHTDLLQGEVRTVGADLGIALDGDGDRCLVVDERGRLVDGDALLLLLAKDMNERRKLAHGRVVATVMSNRGLHLALARHGIGVETVPVGDKHVVEALRTEELSLGGEQSGHIVFGNDNAMIGDGILTGLRTLDCLRRRGGSVSGLAAEFVALPQVLLNVRVRTKPPVEEVAGLMEAVREVEAELGDAGRVLLRYSGTEPLARVMVEGPDRAMIGDRARRIAALIENALGEEQRA
ncbi:MAG: phosphoglucosamine mutase [Planctomycetota bacterium]